MTGIFRPPYIIEFRGDLDLLYELSSGDQLILCENGRFSASLCRKDLLHAWHDPSTSMVHVCKKDKTLDFREGVSGLRRLAEGAGTVLVTQGDPIFMEKITACLEERYGERSEDTNVPFFAIPGEPGCHCNQLIKNRTATLCDCIKDLTDALAEKGGKKGAYHD